MSTASKLRTFFAHLENKFQKQQTQKQNTLSQSDLIGKWIVYLPNREKTFPLEITPEGRGSFNDQPLQGEITHASSDQLIVKDRYGYHLTIKRQKNDEYVLYDELGEEKYPIEKQ